MKTRQKRKVIHRIAADAIVEIDERRNLVPAAENVPQREVLVNQAACLKLEQGTMSLDFRRDAIALLCAQKAAPDKKMQVSIQMQKKIIFVPRVIAMQAKVEWPVPRRTDALPGRHRRRRASG